jgi:hypothetical protein
VGLTLAGLCAVAAAVSQSSALLLVIPVLFLLTFSVSLLNGKARRVARDRARKGPLRLPHPLSFSDARARSVISRLDAAREAIRSAAEAAPSGAAFDLSALIGLVPRLERHLVVLAARVEYLASQLDSKSVAAAQDELLRITEQANRAEGHVRSTYLRAVEVRQGRLTTLAELGSELETVLADAELALVALEALPARMAAVQFRRLQSCEDPAAELSQDTARITEALQAIEEGLVSLPRAEPHLASIPA